MIRLVAAIVLAGLPGLAGAAELAAPADRPALARFTVTTLEGKRLREKDLTGKVGVISFWATWCSPCKQELDALSALAAKHGEALRVVAIATDGPETRATVRSVAGRKAWKVTVALDEEGAVGAQLNPRGSVPFTLFVDRQGRIAAVHPGFKSGDEAAYAAVISALLAEP